MSSTRARLLAAMLVPSFFAVGPVGCGGDEKGQQTEGCTLTMFAASSLTDAFELESTFEEQNPGTHLAKNVLANAEAEGGGDFERRVLDKVVSREANVQASANRVALGEVDATFVYQSDVTPDVRERVQIIRIPENPNVLATYPIATTEGSQDPELAQEWVDLVLSDEGQAVLLEHGFERVR